MTSDKEDNVPLKRQETPRDRVHASDTSEKNDKCVFRKRKKFITYNRCL
jgi:hypothetical protein